MAEQVKLVVLADTDEAFTIIARLDHIGDHTNTFGDNGGEPDGNSFMRPATDLPEDILAALVESGSAYVVDGWEEGGYHGSEGEQERMDDHAKDWSGYSGNNELFYVANEPAPSIEDLIAKELDDEDIQAWHDGAAATEHVADLIDRWHRPFSIWGSRSGPEPLTVELL